MAVEPSFGLVWALRVGLILVLGIGAALALSTVVDVLLATLPHADPKERGTDQGNSSELPTLLLRERRINAWIGSWRYFLAIDAEITAEDLTLRASTGSETVLRSLLSDLPVVWFVHRVGGWMLFAGDLRREMSTFQLAPRNPRRWYSVLSQTGVPLRPSDLTPGQLPEIQAALLVQSGVLIGLLLFVIGASSLVAWKVVYSGLGLLGQ